jgi:hypothetical protein
MNNDLWRVYWYLWPTLSHSTIGHYLDFCDTNWLKGKENYITKKYNLVSLV